MSKNYVELKVSDLREECKKRNLEAAGLKVHLVERLTKYDKDILNLENSKLVEKKSPEPDIDITVDNDKGEDTSNVQSSSGDVKSSCKVTPKKVVNLFEMASSEPDGWESRTDVHLDFYNSDLNIVIDSCGYSAQPICDGGFEYMFGGVKANYGVKTNNVYFEVNIVKRIDIRLESEVGDSNVIRVGWSTNNSSLVLGEEPLSFGFDNLGKKWLNNEPLDYGTSLKEGDKIGCFLEFYENNFTIHFSVNNVDQGEAFSCEINDLNNQFLLPHIYVRNMIFNVNFGGNVDDSSNTTSGDENISDTICTMIGNISGDELIRTCMPPKSKSECEVLMMCGLPSCGKTTWVDKTSKSNLEKFYNILSTNVILEKMKVMSLRKKCAGSRWDNFIQSATQCLNKLMEIAVTRRRNFILDQTNVYPTAQRRRMKTFEEFIRKAIIIIPTDDEYQRRMNQVITEEGKDVPESAVLQMKENFVIPEESSDLFKEIVFIELQRSDAEELVKKYNEESKAKKKAEEQNNKRPEREENDSYGLWNESPKSEEKEASAGPPATKKSRWNEDKSSDDKSSSKYKDKDRDYKSSSSHATRKNDYKENGDTEKGTGSRSSYRSSDKYALKDRSRSKDKSHSDKHSSRSGVSDSRRGRDRSDDGRRDRSRERTNDQRGGYGQSRDRSDRGGYNDKRQSSAYDGGESRSRFPRSDYSGSGSTSNRQGGYNSASAGYDTHEQPRMSRFGGGQPFERGGRGGRDGTQGDSRGGNIGRGGYGQMNAAGSGVGMYQQKYSEFNPFESSGTTQSSHQMNDSQDYEFKSATNYDMSQEMRAGGAARSGLGMPKQVSASLPATNPGRTGGGRWGGAPTSFDEPTQSSLAPNYGLASSRFPDNRQYEGNEEYYGDGGSGYGDMKMQSGSQRGGAIRGRGGFAIPFETNMPAQKPSFYDNKSTYEDKNNAAKYNNPYDKKTDSDTKFTNPYDQKPASRFGPSKPDSTQRITNAYDTQSPGATGASSYDVSKFSNPYDANATQSANAMYGGKAMDDSQRFTNPYEANKSAAALVGYKDSSKQLNPYAQKVGQGQYGNVEQTKYNNPYDITKQATYAAKIDESPAATVSKFISQYNNKSGPSTGSYGAPSQTLNTEGDYENYQSYESTDATQDYDYYGIDTKQSSNFASRATGTGQGSYGSNTSASGYGKPTPTGAVAAGQPSVSYNSTTSGSYNLPSTGSFKTPVSGAYNAQSRGTYNAPIKTPYNSATSGAYNAASGGYSAAITGATSATYNSQSTGAYNSQSGGACSAQSSGAYGNQTGSSYGAQSAAMYGDQTTAAYSTSAGSSQTSGSYGQQLGPYKTPSSGAYGAASGGTYNTPSGAATSGAYYTQSSGAYNTPSSGAYNTPSSGAYNTPSSGAYNPPSGTYKGQPGAAYNASSEGAYNAQLSGSYKTQPMTGYSAAGAFGNKSSTGAYSSSSYGSFTNTATGAYGNQSGGTYGTANPKSSSSDSKGNPISTGGGSYSNPYSNCYENQSGSDNYDYYSGQGAKTTPGAGKAVPGISETGAAAGGYHDYSQYYGQR